MRLNINHKRISNGVKSLDLRPAETKPKKVPPQPMAKRLPQLKPRPAWGRQRASWVKPLIGFLVLAAASAGILGFIFLPEAWIKVAMRTEATARDFEIRVSENQIEPDSVALAIPGKVLEREVEGTKTYPATGSKNVGKTASGFVTIYNFSKTTLILKAQTTVLSANGKRYFFTQDVGNIRPTAFIGLTNQEIDPTSLVPPVPVKAEGPGEAYNLPVGTRLEIENEAFGSQPQVLYAVVAENISGGTTKEVKVLTAGDVTSAFADLEEELVDKARQELAAGKKELRLLDNAAAVEIVEQASSHEPGAESQEFSVASKIRLKALVYSENDVLSVVITRIKRLLPENKVLKEGSGGELQSSFLAVNFDEGTGVLKNHFEGKLTYQVDSEDLLRKIRGKRVEEIREVLLSRPEIAEVTIKFYPFWVRKAPSIAKKIHLEIGP